MDLIAGAKDSPKIFANKITRWHNPSVAMDTLDHCHPPGGVKSQFLITLIYPKQSLKQLKNFHNQLCGPRLRNPSAATARGIPLTAVLERQITPLIVSAW